MDLLTIASSDVNRPLLRASIPVLIKALRMRGETNQKLVVDVVNTLLQLTFDKDCLAVLKGNAAELTNLLQQYVAQPKYDLQACLASQNLQNLLQEPPVMETATKPSGKGRLFDIAKAVMKDKSVAAAADGKERRKSATTSTATKHVMLSYNWGSKSIVRRVDELLRANGIKTWIDE